MTADDVEIRAEAAGDVIAAMVTARIGGDDRLALDLFADADAEDVALVAVAYVVALGKAMAEEVTGIPFAEWWERWCAANAARL